MKTLSYVIQVRNDQAKVWSDEPFNGLNLETGLAKLSEIRPSNSDRTFRLVKRVTVTSDTPVKEPKAKRKRK